MDTRMESNTKTKEKKEKEEFVTTQTRWRNIQSTYFDEDELKEINDQLTKWYSPTNKSDSKE